MSWSVVSVLAAMALAIAGLYLAIRLIGVVGEILGRLFVFIGDEIRDSLQFAGSILKAALVIPAVLFSVMLGRWSEARHRGQKIEVELIRAGRAIYQVAIGNLMKAFSVKGGVVVALGDDVKVYDKHGAIEELEKELETLMPGQSPSDFLNRKEPKSPKQVARAAAAARPGRDKPKKKDEFEGYRVVGSLPTGGSGAKIYVADLDKEKRSTLTASGLEVPDQVVIKCFQLEEGSNLSQIVRESRALESAKRLGMVLEHGLDERRYFYVMPYVPGENLSLVTSKLHAKAGAEGLGQKQVTQALGFLSDLLTTLDHFHTAGLWHKDVKPDNIIVRDGRAHLVDLGLVTPLGSAMTLTTHGTEYFRDPELVRQALRGAKVHEVDGARFDLYAAGAVLFSVIEDSFPAHGSLSSVSKKCPDAVQWIIRRAMADLDSRYRSAEEMLADVRKVQEARDPFAVRPAELPSMGGRPAEQLVTPPPTQALPPLPKRPEPIAQKPGHTPPPVPGDGVYRPTPQTAAYAEESVKHMPPPVPSKARAHALNAAREAKEALLAVRSSRWDARDARKRARKALAEARRRAAVVRASVGGAAASVTPTLAKKKEEPKPFVPSHVQENFDKRERKRRRKHRGGLTWGGWAVMILAVVPLTLILLSVAGENHSSYEYGQPARATVHTEVKTGHSGAYQKPANVIGITHSYGGNSKPVAVATPNQGPRLFDVNSVQKAERIPEEHFHELVEGGRKFDKDFPVSRGKGRFLILDEMTKSGEGRDQDYMTLRNSMTNAGFGVVDMHHKGERDSEVLALIAAARNAMGIYSFDDPGTQKELEAFLLKNPALDGILWVGIDSDGESVHSYLLTQASYQYDSKITRLIKQVRVDG